MLTAVALGVSAGGFSAAHAAEYVNEEYGFAFEMPRSCEEMPTPIFEHMLKTISTDKLPSLNQQYVTAIQCDNMPWFEYPYFVVEYRPGDFRRFINEPAPLQAKPKAPAKSAPPNPFDDNPAIARMPTVSIDHDRKIIFSAMDVSPGSFPVKDMGAGFFREDAMVFLHFYVPHRLAKHFTPIFDHAVTSFRFVERPLTERPAVKTQPARKPAATPGVKPKAVKATSPEPGKPKPAAASTKPASPPKSPDKLLEKPPEALLETLPEKSPEKSSEPQQPETLPESQPPETAEPEKPE